MEQMEVIRAHFGNKPIKINSGYRSPAHNKKIGGASGSLHKSAKANDFTIKGVAPKDVQAGVKELMRTGKIEKGGLGYYNSFTHYDIGRDRSWRG